MDHYYTKNPHVDSKQSIIQAKLRGKTWDFVTDSGVFSKGGVDYGTRLLVESIELTDGDDILDLGCGYGVVGIVLGNETPNGTVVMVDINERAVELSRKNCQIHKIHNAVILPSDAFENVPKQTFNHIITNPPIRAGKAKIYSMFEDSVHYLKDTGSVWVVIQKKQGAESATKKLENLYKNVEIVNKKSGYLIIRANNI